MEDNEADEVDKADQDREEEELELGALGDQSHQNGQRLGTLILFPVWSIFRDSYPLMLMGLLL